MKQRVSARWEAAILVCRKCSKRVDGGFGPHGKQPLAKALKAGLKPGKGRKASFGVVEVKCLGVCPRGAVTVVNGNEPGTWRIVRPGTPIEQIAADLGLADVASE